MKQYQSQLAPLPKKLGDKLPVNEIFYSIQGEGRWLGTPSIFIRLQYCNLGCAWCDTRYTWDSELLDGGALLAPGDLAAKAKALVPPSAWDGGVPHVVITGGEPMLHQDRIPVLVNQMKAIGFKFFEVETGGAIIPEPAMLAVVDWWNCSPKLANSLISKEERVVPEAIQILSNNKNVDFKFVVRDKNDIDEIESTYLSLILPEQIWLIPEGCRRTVQLRRMKEIVDVCLEKGYRLNPRLHILIWDNERGK